MRRSAKAFALQLALGALVCGSASAQTSGACDALAALKLPDATITAAVAVDTQQADAAKTFIHFLTTPAAVAVIKARGMNPG